MGRQARSDEQKQAKADRILSAATELYTERGFDETDVASIAAASGIAKGTFYLYFPTKEELFLTMYRRAWQDWTTEMKSGLTDPGLRHSIPKVVALLARTLGENRRLVELMAILHTRIEGNITGESALAFTEELRDDIEGLGQLLEEQLEFLQPGEGRMLMTRTRALIIGLSHLAYPAPVIAHVLERPDMSLFRIDLPPAVSEMLMVMLMGLKGRRG